MLNLRLAEYDLETGEFVRFLELGKDFGYFRDYIWIASEKNFPDGIVIKHYFSDEKFKFQKDLKDPLNRFDGLFDGRTYGDGRFVLIKNNDFTIYEIKFLIYKQKDSRIITEEIFRYSMYKDGDISCDVMLYDNNGNPIKTSSIIPIGNLHENPELYEKIL